MSLFSHVSQGKDMAYEHVHYNPAVVYCTLVGGEVHCGVPGFPLYPYHDRASAQTHPYQDLWGKGAGSCESHS